MLFFSKNQSISLNLWIMQGKSPELQMCFVLLPVAPAIAVSLIHNGFDGQKFWALWLWPRAICLQESSPALNLLTQADMLPLQPWLMCEALWHRTAACGWSKFLLLETQFFVEKTRIYFRESVGWSFTKKHCRCQPGKTNKRECEASINQDLECKQRIYIKGFTWPPIWALR